MEHWCAGKEGNSMKYKLENLAEEANDNADIIIEYLKMILERLDALIITNVKR